jgi:hypothetical protein
MEPCQRDQDVSEPVESPAEERGAFSESRVFLENWEIAIVVTILMGMYHPPISRVHMIQSPELECEKL